MYIYVIEMLMNDEMITSHIFLTQVNAYRKFIDVLGKYYDSTSIKTIWLIEREINDETGVFHDREIDKMESPVLEDEEVSQED